MALNWTLTLDTKAKGCGKCMAACAALRQRIAESQTMTLVDGPIAEGTDGLRFSCKHTKNDDEAH